ncbi:hypothetical protein JVU11DRAFT_11607 [Chiua virens]|nr:hypothetical protein JVU11DRAFT_11607 [Chiua virens]
MYLLVHSFLLAVSFACAFVNAYDPQAHIQQPYEIATVASVSYTSPSGHDDVISTPSRAKVAEPSPFGMQLQSGVVHDDQTSGVSQAEVLRPGAEFLFLSGDSEAFAESNSAMANGTTDITDGSVSSQGGGTDGVTRLVHALPQVGGVVVAVFTFACLESLLSYAVTGKTPLGLVSGRIKSAR